MAAIPLALDDGSRPKNEQLPQSIFSAIIFYTRTLITVYRPLCREIQAKTKLSFSAQNMQGRMHGINRYRAGTARINACGDSRLRGL